MTGKEIIAGTLKEAQKTRGLKLIDRSAQKASQGSHNPTTGTLDDIFPTLNYAERASIARNWLKVVVLPESVINDARRII